MAKKNSNSDRFQWSSEAEAYYNNIENNSKTGKFSAIFNFYYLCSMVGFQSGIISKSRDNLKTFRPNAAYPEYFNGKRHKMLASLASAELNRKATDLTKKEAVTKELNRLLDSDALTILSLKGVELLDRYSEAGFQQIKKDIGEVQDLSIFMNRYYKKYILSD